MFPDPEKNEKKRKNIKWYSKADFEEVLRQPFQII